VAIYNLPSSCKVTYAGKVLSLTQRVHDFRIVFEKSNSIVPMSLLNKLWTSINYHRNRQSSHNKFTSQVQAGSSENIIENIYGLGYRLRCN